MTAPASPIATIAIKDLDTWDLRDAASILTSHVSSVRVHLDEDASHIKLAATHLLKLAELKEADDAKKLAAFESWLSAEAVHNAEVDALIAHIKSVLSVVGTRKSQAVKLLEQFDITAKG